MSSDSRGKALPTIQVHQHRPANAAQDYQDGHHPLNGPAVIQDSQGTGVGYFGKDGKAGVVEGGNGQEEGLPKGLAETEVGNFPDGGEQDNRPGQVNQEYHDDDVAGQLPQAAQLVAAHGFPQRQILGDAGTLADEGQHKGGGGHEPQAAHQHQNENHRLPEVTPVLGGADSSMAGDGNRGGGGKEGYYRRSGTPRLAVGNGNGQGQQDGAGDYQAHEPVEENERWSQGPFRPAFRLFPEYPGRHLGGPGQSDNIVVR